MVRLLAALAATGVILGAVYLLFMFHKVFFGKLDKAKNGKLPDLRPHELAVFVLLAAGILFGGLFPRPLLHAMEPAVDQFISDYNKHVDEPDCGAHMYTKGCGVAAATPAPVATTGGQP
jgi:NADH-quinone oxidoreductase subunit M